jgi:sialate O-acetylesterase
MEFSTNMAFDAEAELEDSANYPNLRLYTIADTAADTPQIDGKSKTNYQWGVSNSSAFQPVGGAGFSYFSATCYFFGRDLYKALGGAIPIGLVASDWGGQKVECFSSPDAIQDATCGGTVNASTNNELVGGPLASRRPNSTLHYTPLESLSLVETDGDEVQDQPNPGTSQLWFGQIYPFINMRFTGATWYQGEANAGDPDGYACRFPAMIADWRKKFDLPNLSFFFVQLAAFQSDYSAIRAAQMAALQLPKTGFACAIDIGDPTSPAGGIHPRRKQEVGRRLNLACQKVQYGLEVVSEGPTLEAHKFTQATAAGGSMASATVTFRADTAVGLHQYGTAACAACCTQSPMELQTAVDLQWVRTGPMTISGTSVTAAINTTKKIVGVRFDWTGYPQCALYNGVGGPDNHTGIAAPPFMITPPPPPPVSWKLVYRQTVTPNGGGLWKSGELSVNPTDETNDMFATLDKVCNYYLMNQCSCNKSYNKYQIPSPTTCPLPPLCHLNSVFSCAA